MKRILIIGNSSAGKTTFARQLSAKIGITLTSPQEAERKMSQRD